ncbi:nuclear transport factor 2 family protein [Psychroflexus sp. CAK57W]|uniref:nuclear transport factor 2 family protein n=1 Tax=Psychroflexus curvus TaxID=2873595 RepID=UPI001CCE1571|nr:nuclear transport factor 2 family protein [Psychroflexus curvus]MBZ9788408.1 nuclear transport factor 2 family protein [Psychroflexus curvus]
MKKLILAGLTLGLFIACQNQECYTQESAQIDTYKKVITDYENQDWESFAMHYADTAKIANNVTEDQAKSLTEVIESNKEDASLFTTWDFVDEEDEYEMIVTDEGETWVNYWGLWQGTLKADGNTYEIPAHMTAQFVDGKIVKEFGYWDVSPLLFNPNNVVIVDQLYKAFSAGEIPKVLELMDENIVWNEAESNAYADGNPYIGPEAVLNGVFARVGAEYKSFNLQDIELHNMRGNQVLATLRYDAKHNNGNNFNAQVAHLWTLNDGKITAFQQYVDTKKLYDATGK